MRHLVIKGSSGWVIDRNVTRACDLKHSGENALILPNEPGDQLSLVESGYHSHTSISRFTKSDYPSSPELVCLSEAPSAVAKVPLDYWAKLCCVFNRVHIHTCSHAYFSDMRALMQRNGFWNKQVQRYLAEAAS